MKAACQAVTQCPHPTAPNATNRCMPTLTRCQLCTPALHRHQTPSTRKDWTTKGLHSRRQRAPDNHTAAAADCCVAHHNTRRQQQTDDDTRPHYCSNHWASAACCCSGKAQALDASQLRDFVSLLAYCTQRTYMVHTGMQGCTKAARWYSCRAGAVRGMATLSLGNTPPWMHVHPATGAAQVLANKAPCWDKGLKATTKP